VDHAIVRTPADLYKLGIAALTGLERMAQTSANNVVAAIAKAEALPWHASFMHSEFAMWVRPPPKNWRAILAILSS